MAQVDHPSQVANTARFVKLELDRLLSCSIHLTSLKSETVAAHPLRQGTVLYTVALAETFCRIRQ